MKQHVAFDLEFHKNPYPGLYIVLEGVNASGKTTQVNLLKTHFEQQGKEVIITSEPNDDLAIGQLVRQILKGNVTIPPAALQYLYTADRIVNHESIVIPALKEGKIVLSSRSFWSAIVYGILDKGRSNYTRPDANLLLVAQGILSMYHRFLLANHTFYLDITVDEALRRMKAMNNVSDIYEKKEKLSQIIDGYRWLLNEFPDQLTRIDGGQTIEKITEEMIHEIQNRQ